MKNIVSLQSNQFMCEDLAYDGNELTAEIIIKDSYHNVFPTVSFNPDAYVNMFVGVDINGLHIELSSNDDEVDNQLQTINFTIDTQLRILYQLLRLVILECNTLDNTHHNELRDLMSCTACLFRIIYKTVVLYTKNNKEKYK